MKSRTHVTFDDDDLDELEKNAKPLKSFSNKKVSENEKPKDHKQGKKVKRKANEDIEEIFSKKPIKKKKTSQDSSASITPSDHNATKTNNNKKKKNSNKTNDDASHSNDGSAQGEHAPSNKSKKKGKQSQSEMDVDSEDAKRFRDFLCFHCGESGHTKSNCPARTKINNILYMGNLPEDIKDEKLKAFLKPSGTVTKIVYVTNKETGVFKGFAYVTMSSDDEATKAINMEDKYLGTRELIIQYPNSPKQGVCLNCNQEGHMKNECPKKNQNFCYSCGKMGHNRSNCPNKLTVDKKECFNCGEVGHISRECPKKSFRGGNRSNQGYS